MGKQLHLGTEMLRKSVLFFTEEGTGLIKKWHFLLRKKGTFHLEKGHFLGVGNFGRASALGSLIAPPLTVPLQGQWERFTGTISRFRRRYKGPNVTG